MQKCIFQISIGAFKSNCAESQQKGGILACIEIYEAVLTNEVIIELLGKKNESYFGDPYVFLLIIDITCLQKKRNFHRFRNTLHDVKYHFL